MSTTSELGHLFRSLKAPAAAAALPTLAARARAEEWTYERFAEALLSSETSSREAHGGAARLRSARFPSRKSLEEFDWTFQRSVKKEAVLHLAQLATGWSTTPRSSRSRATATGSGARSSPPSGPVRTGRTDQGVGHFSTAEGGSLFSRR